MTAIASLAAAFALTSPAFSAGHPLPARYTCDGADVSPPLRWTQPPRGTRALVLRVVDLDTRPRQFRHWYLSGIPVRLRALAAGTRIGQPRRNDFGVTGYSGPCPPPGQRHRYRFELVALDVRRRVLAAARLLATYSRR